jgi:membrane protein YdbS with pleckstrin-like domain
VKVWRRWFMLNIWLVGGFMIIAVIFTYIFTNYDEIFEWFSIYWLCAFIFLSVYISFILLGARCKQVKVSKC